jgi:hypothetical protein
LRLAGGYRVGYSTTPSRCAPRLYRSRYRRPASADFLPWRRLRVLPAVCAASFARGSVGYLNPGLLALLDCT